MDNHVAKELAKEIFSKHKDEFESLYIEFRRHRLGSLQPEELMYEEHPHFADYMMNFGYLVRPETFEKVEEYLAQFVLNLMEDVEGVI